MKFKARSCYAHGPSSKSTSAHRCTAFLPAPLEGPPVDRMKCHYRRTGYPISFCEVSASKFNFGVWQNYLDSSMVLISCGCDSGKWRRER